MAQTTLTIRIDEGVKKSFEHLCNELGLNLSVAITAFAKESIRENRLPLSLCADPSYINSGRLRRLEEMSAAELNAKLEEGLIAMKGGNSRPAGEVFDELEKEFGFENI